MSYRIKISTLYSVTLNYWQQLLQQNKIVGNIIHKIPYNVVFLQFFDKFLICANINFVCDKDDGTIFSAKMFDFFCPFELHVCHAVRAIIKISISFYNEIQTCLNIKVARIAKLCTA